MPVTPTYPGVYIEEIPSGVRAIIGVATSITAFVGRTRRGPLNEPTMCNNYGDFERIFGGLWAGSQLPYAVSDFFLNGGAQALIVRLFRADEGNDALPASVDFTVDGLTLQAASPGTWGRDLRVSLGTEASASVAQRYGLSLDQLFSLTVADTSSGGRAEQFNNVTLEDGPRRIDMVLANESRLLRWKGQYARPAGALAKVAELRAKQKALLDAKAAYKANPTDPNKAAVKTAEDAVSAALGALRDPVGQREYAYQQALLADPAMAKPETKAAKDAVAAALAAIPVSDGAVLGEADFTGQGMQAANTGLYALQKADLFNLLCIPPHAADIDLEPSLTAQAAMFCEARRAFLLVDPPITWRDKDAAKTGAGGVGTRSRNAALFFPRLRRPDPLAGNQPFDFAPCGAMAGVFARTDTERGVWKAPAGLDATVRGVRELSVKLTDDENGELNPLGVNCLRTFPAVGTVVWGSRTLQGDDRFASEWKYIPVRRLALYIEESLYRGTQWVVFEPNDEPLWAQIRLNVGAFMNTLFRQGAFQGRTPREAYFVKCDRETTPQADIDRGVVNIRVGFAPLKPAEFVIIQIQQMAGQIAV